MIEVLVRASISCHHAIAQLHKVSENLRIIWANESTTGITGNYFIVLSQFDNTIFFLFSFLIAIFMHFSAQHVCIRKFWVCKRIHFQNVWFQHTRVNLSLEKSQFVKAQISHCPRDWKNRFAQQLVLTWTFKILYESEYTQ